MIELHHYGLKKAQVDALSWYVAMYALHSHFKSEAKIDDLNTSYNFMHSNVYSEANRRNLLMYCLQLVNGKYNTPQFNQIPRVVTAPYKEEIPYLSGLVRDRRKINMPKKRDLGFFPVGIKMSGKLINHVKKDLKWFAHMFRTNEIFSKMWDSVFVDGQERGDLDSFIAALPEQAYEPDDDSESHNDQIEIDEADEGNYVSEVDDSPIETPVIAHLPSENDDLNETENRDISPSTTAEPLNLDELISTAESEYDIQMDEVGNEMKLAFYANLEEEIEGEDNPDGSLTIERLREKIDEDAPMDVKQQGDQLNRLFNQVFTMPWSNAFKFACMLVFIEKKVLIDGDTQYIVLSGIDLQLISKFAANYDTRKDVLNANKQYSQRIFNVN